MALHYIVQSPFYSTSKVKHTGIEMREIVIPHLKTSLQFLEINYVKRERKDKSLLFFLIDLSHKLEKKNIHLNLLSTMNTLWWQPYSLTMHGSSEPMMCWLLNCPKFWSIILDCYFYLRVFGGNYTCSNFQRVMVAVFYYTTTKNFRLYHM